MPIDNFIIAVFCLIDDELKKMLNGKRLRQRGPFPGLQERLSLALGGYADSLHLIDGLPMGENCWPIQHV